MTQKKNITEVGKLKSENPSFSRFEVTLDEFKDPCNESMLGMYGGN
ncbi:hypothetical protein [Algoriphagus jejuensis]